MMSNDKNSLDSVKSGQIRTEDLSPNQQKALAALLTAPTIAAAAEQSGLSVRTVKRYLTTPEFAAVYREQRALLLAETVAGLEKTGLDAVSALQGALEDEDVSVRLRAARSVIEFMLRGSEHERRIREIDEIQAEIDELKELVESQQKEHGRNGSRW